MKKLLKLLFLLFALNASTAFVGGGEIINEKSKNDYIIYSEEVEKIKSRIEDESTAIYLYLDSIPIYSPIKPTLIQGISSDYGYRLHPIYKHWHKHVGIDIKSELNTNVRATANGIVELIKYSKYGYGNQVIIKHANGYRTRYAHLKKINVNKGDIINVKTVLGTVGITGLTTGSHLHYEIIKNGKTIDPMIFTYKNKKERSIGKYLYTMIALERY